MVITDNVEGTEGGDTPVEDEDDFFSSWSRPAVKKLSPPISRTATPPVVGRTPSPFLNAQNGKDTVRSPSPLAKGAEFEAKPASSRITTSAAIRSSATGPRKANILGAKKVTSKLGAKKLGGDVLIDFDEAEKKAKEEAERIEKLGYDPDAEEETSAASKAAGKSDSSAIVSPTPVSPARGGYSHSREKSASEVERLGMGMKRLGFGQVGKPAGAAAAAKKGAAGGGFGSVGPIKASADGKLSLSTLPKHTPLPPLY